MLSRGEIRTVSQRYVNDLRVATPSIDREVRNLSGGNQQKVLLAKWLARHPRILIVDEPTRGVDVGAKADIYRILRDLAADGLALLVVSSDLPEVLALAHRIVVMSASMFDQPDVLKYYLDRIALHRVGKPAELAGVIAFLLSEDASYVTSATLLVDAGFIVNAEL